MSDRDPSGRALRFEVLGPLRAWRGGTALNLGPFQQRVVMAVLLLNANRPIGQQQMINAVWGETEPANAPNLLQRHVSGLRRVLEPGRPERATSGQLVWTDAGYLLTVPTDALDLEIFDREMGLARAARAAHDLPGAAKALHSALALWRGPVCEGLTSPLLDTERDRLAERHVSMVEESIELDLAVGGDADMIAELQDLVAEHPLRERLHGLLMLALYRAGRQPDALAAFQELRHRLSDELGAEPGAPLQQLHQQILAADPELMSRPAEVTTGMSAQTGTRRPVPAQLPHRIPDFTGRDDEISRLNEFLTRDGYDMGGTAVITAIGGTAGVGKTALAIHWAHQISSQFPDGQLYVNLRGFDPAAPAMEPAEAVRGFLDAFAVSPDQVPVDIDGQAAFYRTILAGRRVLIVLDNARDADQVRPLLPGSPECLVVVTSRNQLISLVAVDGAHPVPVDLLAPDAAEQLLARRLGADRTTAEPASVAKIITACAGLPLALSIVSARAEINPRLPLAALADELHEANGGLSALDAGDHTTNVRTVFSWSYQALSAPTARLFRLLGLHAGPDIATPAAASLAGIPPAQGRTLLIELTRAHLLTQRVPGRFSLHDLLRAYAGEMTNVHDPADERRAAVHRLLDHYLHSAYRADELFRPGREDPIVIAPAQPLVTPENPASFQQALTWLTTEHRVLLAALRQAANNGFKVHTWQLAWALTSFSHRRGHWHDAATSDRIALEAAEGLGDPQAQAVLHCCLCYAYIPLSRHDEARFHLLKAFKLYEDLGDQVGQAHAHRISTWILDGQGRYREALLQAERAVQLFEIAGHEGGLAKSLNATGWFHIKLGDYEEGLVHCQRALGLQRRIADRFGQADTLDSIAQAYLHLGRYEEAVANYQQAVSLYHELGDRYNEAGTLASLGDTCLAAGDPGGAGSAWQHALMILEELCHPAAGQVRAKLSSLANTTTV